MLDRFSQPIVQLILTHDKSQPVDLQSVHSISCTAFVHLAEQNVKLLLI